MGNKEKKQFIAIIKAQNKQIKTLTEKLIIYLAVDLTYDSNPFNSVVNLTYTTKNGLKFKF